MAMQHTDDESLLANALRNVPKWQARVATRLCYSAYGGGGNGCWLCFQRRGGLVPLVDIVDGNSTCVVYWQGRVGGSSRRIFHAAIFTHRGSAIRR
jgi:hypothetical protein